MKTKVKKETTLKEVLEIKGAQEVLAKHNVPCISCPFAKMEMDKLSLENICKNYNIKKAALLKDLNLLL